MKYNAAHEIFDTLEKSIGSARLAGEKTASRLWKFDFHGVLSRWWARRMMSKRRRRSVSLRATSSTPFRLFRVLRNRMQFCKNIAHDIAHNSSIIDLQRLQELVLYNVALTCNTIPFPEMRFDIHPWNIRNGCQNIAEASGENSDYRLFLHGHLDVYYIVIRVNMWVCSLIREKVKISMSLSNADSL